MEEFTKNQQELIKELKKLSKTANQRILEIERLTKRKTPQFAVKQLADLLSVTNALTKRKGKSIRVSQYKKSMSETDIVGTVKALRNFLNTKKTPEATISGIKKYTQKASEGAGKKLSYAQANVFYQAEQEWKWIFDYVNESDFWDYYWSIFVPEQPSFEDFVSDLEIYLWIGEIPISEDLKEKLKGVYRYLKK